MRFLDTGEKIRKLRKQLNIRQEELNSAGVSRNFISMIENGKRKLPQHVAFSLIDIFRSKADELGIKLEGDAQWLMTSAKEQATIFCNEKLKSDLLPEEIDTMTSVVKDYNIRELMPEVYILKANKLYDEGLYEEAFIYYYEVLECLSPQSKEKAFVYNKLGKCKIKMLNYIEAISYLSKCYEYSILSNDLTSKKNCLYNMALSYFKLGSYDLALSNMEGFIDLCNISVDFKEYVWAIILESNCYIENKKYDLAINILTDLITKFRDPQNQLLGFVYNSLGVVHMDINELDKALYYIEKAQFIREAKDRNNLSHTILNKARILIKQEKEQEAIKLINQSISLAEEYKDYEFAIDSYEVLEKLYLKLKEDSELLNIYLKMIPVFNKTDKKYETLGTYIKLLSITADSKGEKDFKHYLDEAKKML